MIYGIGCDLCAIARMEKILQKPNAAHFLQRVFAPSELALFGLAEGIEAAKWAQANALAPQAVTPPWDVENTDAPAGAAQGFAIPPKTIERLAANFAAKEAFLKATGLGLAGFALADIAALRRESGAPYYAFTGSAADYMARNNLTAHLSLSHEKGTAGMAMAYCILECCTNP